MVDRELSDDAQIDEIMSRLEMSELKYFGLANLLPQQVWTALPNGDLDFVNQVVTTYFGRTAEEFLGSGWLDVLHPEDVQHTVEVWTNSLGTGEPYEIEFRLRRHDGVYRAHIGQALPVRSRSGKIIHWFGTNTDVTEVREAEHLAAIVTHTDDAVVSVGVDGLILRLSTPSCASHVHSV